MLAPCSVRQKAFKVSKGGFGCKIQSIKVEGLRLSHSLKEDRASRNDPDTDLRLMLVLSANHNKIHTCSSCAKHNQPS